MKLTKAPLTLGLLAVIGALASCGTFNTLTRDDRAIARSLVKQNTYCSEITRVYSGVAYDLCILNSHQTGIVLEPLALVYVLDTLASAVTDTIVLPYTIYQQSQLGNVEVRIE